jgi:hypothetical protein
MNSSIFTLDNKDFIKGLLVAVLSAVITILYNTIETGSLNFDWKAIGTMALTSALGYILKNLLTNSTGQFLKKDA